MHTTIQNREQEAGDASQPGVVTTNNARKRPTFAIACWLLALLAFAQLISVGTALTMRSGLQPEADALTSAAAPSPSPIQPRSLEDILASISDAPAPALTEHSTEPGTAPPVRVAALPQVTPARVIPMIPAPANTSSLPTIADPVVEKLVQQSRALQLDGDMMRAMLKLDEAARIDANEPAVIYHKALLFEEMGLLIKAADQYQQVQQMGIKAGVYFKLAASKLTKGMDVAHARRAILSIGPMNTRKGADQAAGKQANVTITVLARPDKPVNPADVDLQIHFYDKLNGGEIKKASAISQIETSWTREQPDWQGPGNEETLRISYSIPEADLAGQHLFGRREFYGYVVELFYKGEIIDQQAQPRRLHSVHSRLSAPERAFGQPLPWLPDDHNSLLPGKDDHGYGDNPSLPPLPTR